MHTQNFVLVFAAPIDHGRVQRRRHVHHDARRSLRQRECMRECALTMNTRRRREQPLWCASTWLQCARSEDVACLAVSLSVIAGAVKYDDAVVVQLTAHIAMAIVRAQCARHTSTAPPWKSPSVAAVLGFLSAPDHEHG